MKLSELQAKLPPKAPQRHTGWHYVEGLSKPYRVRVTRKGKCHNLGYYATQEEAEKIYKEFVLTV